MMKGALVRVWLCVSGREVVCELAAWVEGGQIYIHSI